MSEAEITIGKVLVPKQEDLCSFPQNPHLKTLGVVVLDSNPSTGKMKASGALGLTGQSAQPK